MSDNTATVLIMAFAALVFLAAMLPRIIDAWRHRGDDE